MLQPLTHKNCSKQDDDDEIEKDVVLKVDVPYVNDH